MKQKYSNPSFKAPASGIVLVKRRATSESIVSIATIIFFKILHLIISSIHLRLILEYIDINMPINTPIVIETIVKKNKGISTLLFKGQIPIEILSEFAIEKNTTRRKKLKILILKKFF